MREQISKGGGDSYGNISVVPFYPIRLPFNLETKTTLNNTSLALIFLDGTDLPT